MSNKEIISTEEACKLLGLSRQTLYKLSDAGKIPGKKLVENIDSQTRNIKLYSAKK